MAERLSAEQENWGKKPADASEETTHAVHYDHVFNYPAVAPAKTMLWSAQGSSKGKRYQNVIMDKQLANNKIAYQIFKADVNIEFAALGTEAAACTMKYYLENTKINIVKNGVNYDSISLSDLVPFTLQNVNGTWSTIPKENFIGFEFPEPLLLPFDGALSFEYDPAPTLVAGASATTNPHVYEANLTSNIAFWVKFTLFGTQRRQVA